MPPYNPPPSITAAESELPPMERLWEDFDRSGELDAEKGNTFTRTFHALFIDYPGNIQQVGLVVGPPAFTPWALPGGQSNSNDTSVVLLRKIPRRDAGNPLLVHVDCEYGRSSLSPELLKQSPADPPEAGTDQSGNQQGYRIESFSEGWTDRELIFRTERHWKEFYESLPSEQRPESLGESGGEPKFFTNTAGEFYSPIPPVSLREPLIQIVIHVPYHHPLKWLRDRDDTVNHADFQLAEWIFHRDELLLYTNVEHMGLDGSTKPYKKVSLTFEGRRYFVRLPRPYDIAQNRTNPGWQLRLVSRGWNVRRNGVLVPAKIGGTHEPQEPVLLNRVGTAPVDLSKPEEEVEQLDKVYAVDYQVKRRTDFKQLLIRLGPRGNARV